MFRSKLNYGLLLTGMIRLLIIASLLTPRIAFAGCQCNSGCNKSPSVEKDQPKNKQPESSKKSANSGCCCCCCSESDESGETCCCTTTEGDSGESEVKQKESSCCNADSNKTSEADQPGCKGNCHCSKYILSWATLAPVKGRDFVLDKAAESEALPAFQFIAKAPPEQKVSDILWPPPRSCPEQLQPLLCCWLE